MDSMSKLLPFDYNTKYSTLSQLLQELEGVEIPLITMKSMHCNCSALTRKHFKTPDYAEATRESASGWSHIRQCTNCDYVTYDSPMPPSPKPQPQTISEESVWKSISGEPAGWHHRLSCPHESAVDTTQIRIVEQHDIKDAIQNVRDIIQGLCLDCIRSDGEEGQECRSEHAKPWENWESAVLSPWDPSYLDIDCFPTTIVTTNNDGWGTDQSTRVRQAPSWWEKAW